VGILLPPITEALFKDCSTDRSTVTARNPFAELSLCVTFPAIHDVCRQHLVSELVPTLAPLPSAHALHDLVAVVRTRTHWGSAFPFNASEDVFVTCAHCVTNVAIVEIGRLIHAELVWTMGRVLFRGPDANGLDVAIVAVGDSDTRDFTPHTAVLSSLLTPPARGDQLSGLGFGGLQPSSWPSTFQTPLFSHGIVSQVLCDETQPVLLQTTAFVWSGNSGGPAIRWNAGHFQILGMFTRSGNWRVVSCVRVRVTLYVAVRCVIPMSGNEPSCAETCRTFCPSK
jgi:Trypsin-like peptidase domain